MSALPAKYDIRIRQNSPLDFQFTVYEMVGTVKQLKDLTGYTGGSMQIRADADSDPIETPTVSINIPTSVVTATLTQAETLAIPDGIYLYDIFLVNGSAENEWQLTGKFIVDRAITR